MENSWKRFFRLFLQLAGEGVQVPREDGEEPNEDEKRPSDCGEGPNKVDSRSLKKKRRLGKMLPPHSCRIRGWRLQTVDHLGGNRGNQVKFVDKMEVGHIHQHIFFFLNPLTTNAKSCSDLAEIFSVASFIY